MSGSLRTGWLTFQSASGKRRLPVVPRGWEHLPDQELWALFERAVTAPSLPIPRRRDLHDGPPTDGRGQAPAARLVPEVPGIVPHGTTSPGDEPVGALTEESIRAYARHARRERIPVIQALVELKRRLLAVDGDVGPSARKRARGWFVDTYYLERPAAGADAQADARADTEARADA